ncbi:MAG: hypothetical protein PHE59_04480 [Patescibacteria group bacterium]|nr:hypothetical protein [Patescibacteria group bacterium]MDD5164569.1 hypothetical protein [Patescibacteria group bacterium]MDD5534306.1 hypothetical protein [Patescibacteria group bacterium]
MVSDIEEQETEQSIAVRLKAERAEDVVKSDDSGTSFTGKTKELKDAAQRLKTVYRIINGASAITVVGLIVTFLLMNAQLIFGNLLKVKFVPALEIWEIIILGIIDVIILTVLFCLIVLSTISVVAITDPGELFKLLWSSGLQIIKNAFSPS